MHGVHLRDHLFFAAGAYAAMLKGDEKVGREFLEKMHSAIPAGRRFARCQYNLLCSWNHLLRDDAVGAAAHAERALSHAEAAGEWEEALACYRKGREADSHHEEFHRRIMICHHWLGRTGEALSAYQQCRRTLKAALGTVPSPETEAVLESIRNSAAKSPGPAG